MAEWQGQTVTQLLAAFTQFWDNLKKYEEKEVKNSCVYCSVKNYLLKEITFILANLEKKQGKKLHYYKKLGHCYRDWREEIPEDAEIAETGNRERV